MACGHYVVTFLNRRPTFECYITKLVVNNTFQIFGLQLT